jgi:hypothetical protein
MSEPPPIPTPGDDPYAALGVAAHVGAGQIEAAYRFTLRIYSEDGVAWRGFLTADERTRAVESAMAAYAVLSDPSRRARWDGREPPGAHAERARIGGAVALDPSSHSQPAAERPKLEIPAEVRGRHLRSLREQRGATLADIVALSKVSSRFLEALEEDAHDRLPGRVFARGFLVEYGRGLGVDGSELAERYLRYWTGPR